MEFGEEWGGLLDELPSWVGVHMVVILGGALKWVGKPLVVVLDLRLGWVIRYSFGMNIGVVINHLNWFSWFCM